MDGTALIEKAIEKSRIFGPAIAFRYAGEPAEQMWLWVDGSPGILPEDPIIDLYVRVDFAAGTLTLCDDQYQPVVPEAQMELDAATREHLRELWAITPVMDLDWTPERN